MQIVVNGQPHDVAVGATIAELLRLLKLPAAQVAVEVNLQLVPRRQHDTHRLADGDQLEVVTLVGGG